MTTKPCKTMYAHKRAAKNMRLGSTLK